MKIGPLFVEKVVEGGDGLGYWEGKAVFVPYGAPGDWVEGSVQHQTRDWITLDVHRARALSIDRTIPACSIFGTCGGCQWQHLQYTAQLKWKTRIVQEAFSCIAGLTLLPLEPIRPSVGRFPFLYRNKAIIPIQKKGEKILMGFYRKGTHDVVDAPECPVLAGPLQLIWHGIRRILEEESISIYDERKGKGALRHLTLRMGVHTQEILVGFVSRIPAVRFSMARKIQELDPHIVGVFQNLNPHRSNRVFGDETRPVVGRSYYHEILKGKPFRVSATSFFQINSRTLERLLEDWMEHLSDMEVAVDAYAGVGVFALFLADRARQVKAIEIAPSSVLDLEANVQRHEAHHIEIHVGPFETYVNALPDRIDVVFIDPPRKGLTRKALNGLLARHIREIHYLSCKPSTLARDARVLIEHGYELIRVIPYDFFPQTHHVETLAIFRRKR